MFGDIGLSELFLILVVTLIVTKPADLPVIMRRLGVFYAYIQSFVQGIWLGWQEKMGLFSTQHPNERQKSGESGGE